MVERCRAKAIDAHVMDFLQLDSPAGSFYVVFAMNCLLHVPNHDLPAVLAVSGRYSHSGGLFFLGVYGANDGEGAPKARSATTARAAALLFLAHRRAIARLRRRCSFRRRRLSPRRHRPRLPFPVADAAPPGRLAAVDCGATSALRPGSRDTRCPHCHHAQKAGANMGSSWALRVAECPQRNTLTPAAGKRRP